MAGIPGSADNEVIAAAVFRSWHKLKPSRVWVGYASWAGCIAMPLARFFYGKTHKWFFRTAAAVLVASYVSAVQAIFDQNDWWRCYMVAFGAISGIYWLIYAPAKWAADDNLFPEARPPRNIVPRVIGEEPSGSGSTFHVQMQDDALGYDEVQEILHGGTPPESPSIPEEVFVLYNYMHDEGRSSPTGPYRQTRQWKPPGFWRGHREYDILMRQASLAVSSERVDFFRVSGPLSGTGRSMLNEIERLATLTIFLDEHVAKWRKKARFWR